MGAKKRGKEDKARIRKSDRDDKRIEEEEEDGENGDYNPDGSMNLREDEQTEEYKILCTRRRNLQRTEDVMQKHEVIVQKLINKARVDLVWNQYMKCNGLPDPVCVRQLNTYLSLWKDDTKEDIESVLSRTMEVLPIMSTLENLIENPDEWEEPIPESEQSRSFKSRIQERNKIFDEMKTLQLTKLNRATYNLILDVSPMVDPENNVLQHFLTSELVSLGLWGNVIAKNMRVKGTNFETLGFGFELPADLIGNIFAVRVMRVEYDHYSKMCKSNRIPPRAAKDVRNYYQLIQDRISKIEEDVSQRRQEKRLLKLAFEDQKRAMEEAEKERQRLLMLERKNKKKGALIPPGGTKGAATLSEAEEQLAERTSFLQKQQQELLKQEKEMEEKQHLKAAGGEDIEDLDSGAGGLFGARKAKDPQQVLKETLQERLDLYKIEIDEHELNLRRNIILGGVFYFDMLEIPPQPKKVGNWIIRQLETPQVLKTVSWFADYKPPLPPDENTVTKKTPEEIEREIKLQEMELQKLVLVNLKLPNSSMWFEPPTIVRWEPEKQYWSTEGFYDVKFDEGKQTLTFRTISFGIFALSAFRFSNLPLQSWELTPLDENKALLTLSAAAVQADFEVGEGLVTLVKFSSGNKPPVKGIQDNPMILKDLIKEMRSQGVDIFPDYDSHCYIEGLPLKDIQTERHLYYCMALTANSLNFSWSRWNLLSGYEKLIMQFREKVPGHQESAHQVVLITPEKTSVLECTEASQTFSDQPIEGFEHLYDLYTMALDKCSDSVKVQMPKAKAVFVNTVFQFLTCSKVLSYA